MNIKLGIKFCSYVLYQNIFNNGWNKALVPKTNFTLLNKIYLFKDKYNDISILLNRSLRTQFFIKYNDNNGCADVYYLDSLNKDICKLCTFYTDIISSPYDTDEIAFNLIINERNIRIYDVFNYFIKNNFPTMHFRINNRSSLPVLN